MTPQGSRQVASFAPNTEAESRSEGTLLFASELLLPVRVIANRPSLDRDLALEERRPVGLQDRVTRRNGSRLEAASSFASFDSILAALPAWCETRRGVPSCVASRCGGSRGPASLTQRIGLQCWQQVLGLGEVGPTVPELPAPSSFCHVPTPFERLRRHGGQMTGLRGPIHRNLTDSGRLPDGRRALINPHSWRDYYEQ